MADGVAMKERPILFTPENAQKVFLGTKTQTRRIVKPQPPKWIDKYGQSLSPMHWIPSGVFISDPSGMLGKGNLSIRQNGASVKCPYGTIGDRLWVRESYYAESQSTIHYRGDFGGYEDDPKSGWKNAMFMPRWACRTVVELTAVCVERLQEISEDDAIAEGIEYCDGVGVGRAGYWQKDRSRICATAREAYRVLWESINGPGSWALNPWVWVLEFKKVQS